MGMTETRRVLTEHVSVPEAALAAFIEFADVLRGAVECSMAEHQELQRQFDAHLAALGWTTPARVGD